MHARQHGRNTSILIVRNQQAEISNLRRANPIRVFRRETLYSIPARKTEFFNFHERKRERRDINVSFHGKREILLLSDIGVRVNAKIFLSLVSRLKERCLFVLTIG